MKAYLEAGKIVNTHGIRGDIKVESWCDSCKVLCSLKTVYLQKGEEYLPLTVEKASPFKGMALLHVSGYDTVEDAVRLKNRTLFAKREDLPVSEGAHFVADLIGLPVWNHADGKQLGVLRDVPNIQGRELYEIETERGTVLVPVVDEFVHSVDLEKGIVLTPIEGLF